MRGCGGGIFPKTTKIPQTTRTKPCVSPGVRDGGEPPHFILLRAVQFVLRVGERREHGAGGVKSEDGRQGTACHWRKRHEREGRETRAKGKKETCPHKGTRLSSHHGCGYFSWRKREAGLSCGYHAAAGSEARLLPPTPFRVSVTRSSEPFL